MHPVHRAVFLTGVMSYLSAPLWFMFLALSTALQVVHALTEPQYFLQPRQLFPVCASGVLSWRLHFCFDYGAVVPAEVIEHFAYLVQRNERIRRLLARYIIVAAGSAFFRAAGSGTHAVPYGLRCQRVPWLGSGVEFTAA